MSFGHRLLDLAGVAQAEFEKEVAWGRSASPLIVDDLVVIPLGGVGDQKHTLIAFDRLLGEEALARWFRPNQLRLARTGRALGPTADPIAERKAFGRLRHRHRLATVVYALAWKRRSQR